ncbi:MAG TPA: HAD hydrolase family protein [Terriglobales bacterium]|nr:HAD hydrolase family protein [Terriglobales bacterium]
MEQAPQGWQASEVINNIFLLSCAITDTVDDYLLGDTYDFSKIGKILPFAGFGVRIAAKLLDGKARLRAASLSRLLRWRQTWGAAITEFLKYSLVAAVRERDVLLQQRDLLTSLLPSQFPGPLWYRRPKIPAFFRSRDFAPPDCLELGEKLFAAFPDRERPAIVIGLRTAGSFLAPLLCAYLSDRLQETDWVAIRPRKALAPWEQAALGRAAQKKARALIIDESIHSGQTLAQAVNLLRQTGFADEDIVVLNPVEPAFPRWRNSHVFQSLAKVNIITLEPPERHKQQLLDSRAVEGRLEEYFKARGYVSTRIAVNEGPGSDPDPNIKELNLKWQRESPERVDVRLKRIYEVHLRDAAGKSEVRYVLAKSVGWGWLGYHAFIAGQKLEDRIPPVLGLRDGILYSEWIPEREDSQTFAQDHAGVIATVASYVAARTRNLTFINNPTPDLAREGRHKGFEILASTLCRAYSSRIVAALKRSHIQQQLSQQDCPVFVMTDSKMSPEEWISVGTRLMKADFEHHSQGKNELGMTDPAYDLADAIFHFGFSQEESAQLVQTYVKESGDINVEDRLYLNKLLAGLWAQNLATLGLHSSRLQPRRNEFHQQYTAAWNFLIRATVQECGKLSQPPRQLRWQTPLVVTDIDGVLDRMVFGFPSTTAAGIKAISLLHSHGFAVAVNTARTLHEVKQYCRAYGFAGGAAEYGSIVWDAVSDRELVLVSPESQQQLQQARRALQAIPGVFLNDDYKSSLRAYTYQNGRTAPLPPLLVQDLLAGLKLDRLQVHQTGLDTAILAKEINKGAGLHALLGLVGLPADNVMAIGDSEPDLAMFRVAHRSFAPGNVTCRGEARLLGCHIADHLFQPGLLQIARKIAHPHGGTCDNCRSVEASWSKHRGLFVSLLETADQKPLPLLLRNFLDPSLLAVFRK